MQMGYFTLYGYKKYYKDGEDGAVTGTALLSNTVP